jgi:hypothetical protein
MHINTEGTGEWLKLNNPYRLAQPERRHGYDEVHVTSVRVLQRYLVSSRADLTCVWGHTEHMSPFNTIIWIRVSTADKNLHIYSLYATFILRVRCAYVDINRAGNHKNMAPVVKWRSLLTEYLFVTRRDFLLIWALNVGQLTSAVLWFPHSPGECCDSTFKQATTATLKILIYSSFMIIFLSYSRSKSNRCSRNRFTEWFMNQRILWAVVCVSVCVCVCVFMLVPTYRWSWIRTPSLNVLDGGQVSTPRCTSIAVSDSSC